MVVLSISAHFLWGSKEDSSWNQSFQLSLPIPTAALGTKDRKLDATAVIVSNNELLYSTAPAKVTFPK